MSSPRMICSVKFLHPTTMRGRVEQVGRIRTAISRTISSKTPPCLAKKKERRDKDGAPSGLGSTLWAAVRLINIAHQYETGKGTAFSRADYSHVAPGFSR